MRYLIHTYRSEASIIRTPLGSTVSCSVYGDVLISEDTNVHISM